MAREETMKKLQHALEKNVFSIIYNGKDKEVRCSFSVKDVEYIKLKCRHVYTALLIVKKHVSGKKYCT